MPYANNFYPNITKWLVIENIHLKWSTLYFWTLNIQWVHNSLKILNFMGNQHNHKTLDNTISPLCHLFTSLKRHLHSLALLLHKHQYHQTLHKMPNYKAIHNYVDTFTHRNTWWMQKINNCLWTLFPSWLLLAHVTSHM